MHHIVLSYRIQTFDVASSWELEVMGFHKIFSKSMKVSKIGTRVVTWGFDIRTVMESDDS